MSVLEFFGLTGLLLIACGIPALAIWSSEREDQRARQKTADEKAFLIAFGEGKGVEYVPGEDTDFYRLRVKRAVEREERRR